MAAAVWEYPTTIAAVLVALGVIGKTAHWVYRWAGRIDDSLSYIEGEMRFNGGTTMRDAVKRIEIRIGQIEHNAVRSDSVVAVQADVTTLLDHDDERDTEGKRYAIDEG